MTNPYQFPSSFTGTGILRLAPLDPQTQETALALAPAKPVHQEASFGDSIYPWRPGAPKAALVAGLGALGSTVWYGLSYSGPSSAPWQGIFGSLGAGLIT